MWYVMYAKATSQSLLVILSRRRCYCPQQPQWNEHPKNYHDVIHRSSLRERGRERERERYSRHQWRRWQLHSLPRWNHLPEPCYIINNRWKQLLLIMYMIFYWKSTVTEWTYLAIDFLVGPAFLCSLAVQSIPAITPLYTISCLRTMIICGYKF